MATKIWLVESRMVLSGPERTDPVTVNRTLDVEYPTSLSFCQSSVVSFSSLCGTAVQGNPSVSLHGTQT